MYGWTYSQKASDQVGSYGFDPTPAVYFAMFKNEFSKNSDWGPFLSKPILPVDGNSASKWDEPYFYNLVMILS